MRRRFRGRRGLAGAAMRTAPPPTRGARSARTPRSTTRSASTAPGLVAFGALAFDARSRSSSRLIVPRAIVGRRRRAGLDHPHPLGCRRPLRAAGAGVPYGPYWSATLGPGALDPEGYQAAVRAALDAIAAGEVGKVVLARDLIGTVPAGADLRRLVRALASGLPRHLDVRRRRPDRREPRDARHRLGRHRHRARAGRDLPARSRRRRRCRGIHRPRAQRQGPRRAPLRRAERARRPGAPRALGAGRRRAVRARAAEPVAPRDRRRRRARRPRIGARPGRVAASRPRRSPARRRMPRSS